MDIAQIGDFGTSRWMQHTMSTGLATFTTNSSQNTQMSLAWSAPEVRALTESRTIVCILYTCTYLRPIVGMQSGVWGIQ